MLDREIPKFWHCTLRKNAHKIYEKGLLRGPDGCVYLAETMNDSAKFLLIRGARVDELLFVEVDAAVLNKSKLSYSLDHSVDFFGCEAFSYMGDIAASHVRFNMYTAEAAANG